MNQLHQAVTKYANKLVAACFIHSRSVHTIATIHNVVAIQSTIRSEFDHHTSASNVCIEVYG